MQNLDYKGSILGAFRYSTWTPKQRFKLSNMSTIETTSSKFNLNTDSLRLIFQEVGYTLQSS